MNRTLENTIHNAKYNSESIINNDIEFINDEDNVLMDNKTVSFRI